LRRAIVIGFRSSSWTGACFSGILFNHNIPALACVDMCGVVRFGGWYQVCNELYRRMLWRYFLLTEAVRGRCTISEQGNPYKRLAECLDALPNGFPPTDDGAELRLLAKLFVPEEAALAAQLRLTLETPAQIAARLGGDPRVLRKQLKGMARRGLIAAGRAEGGLGYGLLPFVVGIYEMQFSSIDAELARLFEDYYQQAFGQALAMQPPVHRVVPVGESVQMEVEVRPFESAAGVVAGAEAWGVVDCICRVQKALIGEPCEHPVDVCMVLSETPGAFDNSPAIRALTRQQAMATLRRAAEAGLVHSVGNKQQGLWYICNCCTCSCGVLRGMAEVGIANVVARSPFVNRVDEALCIGCGECVEWCQFGALSLDDVVRVDESRCVGCGVCALACPEEALSLERRPAEEVLPVPVTEADWRAQRAAARGLDVGGVLR
jgi:electron transport complex protein RnfB